MNTDDCEHVGFSGQGRCVEPSVWPSRLCIEHQKFSHPIRFDAFVTEWAVYRVVDGNRMKIRGDGDVADETHARALAAYFDEVTDAHHEAVEEQVVGYLPNDAPICTR